MIAAMTGLLDEQPLQACALTRITAVPDGSEQALVTKDAVPTARCAVRCAAWPRRGRAIPCFRFQREWRE